MEVEGIFARYGAVGGWEIWGMWYNWQIEILNSFIYIDEWRLSNAKIENINGQIKNLMAISYGFTNFERTRTRIIYTINKDYPFSIIKRYDSKQRKKKI